MIRSDATTYSLLHVMDTVPSTLPAQKQYIDSILSPSVPVTMADCQTQLGLRIPLQDLYEYAGMQTVNGETVTSALIATQAAAGTSIVGVRSVSTCTAAGGLCQTCLSSSGLTGTVGLDVRIPVSDRSPYINFLAGTYTGSLFQMQSLPDIGLLPVRRDLYDLIVQPQLNTFLIQVLQLSSANYFENIQDSFEQFLGLALTYCLNNG